MYGYIYKTVNKKNGYIYVGQHKAEKFMCEQYLGSGIALTRAVSRYGKDNFYVVLLDECDTREQLNERERYWIQYYRQQGVDMYNIASGGEGGDIIHTLSEEQITAFKEKVSKSSTGRKHSEETKHKLSLMRRGELNPMKNPEVVKRSVQSHKINGINTWTKGLTRATSAKFNSSVEKMRNTKLEKYGNTFGNYDFTMTQEHKDKIAESLKGKPKSEEHRKKLSEANMGKPGNITGRKAYIELVSGKKRFYYEGTQPDGFVKFADYIEITRKEDDNV